jgi:hypothetical protein
MRGGQIALLGAMLAISGILSGCAADSSDSTSDDVGDVAVAESAVKLAPRVADPAAERLAASRRREGVLAPVGIAVDPVVDPVANDNVEQLSNPNPEGMGDGSDDDGPGFSPEPQPWHADNQHVTSIRSH